MMVVVVVDDDVVVSEPFLCTEEKKYKNMEWRNECVGKIIASPSKTTS
jgi:hypothetical protein